MFVVCFVSERCCCSDGLIFEIPAFLTRWGWPSYCLARVTMASFVYVTCGLGLLLGGFFALFVPFSGIDDDGDVTVVLDANLPIFVANFVDFGTRC